MIQLRLQAKKSLKEGTAKERRKLPSDWTELNTATRQGSGLPRSSGEFLGVGIGGRGWAEAGDAI